jgi:hypothetical protein
MVGRVVESRRRVVQSVPQMVWHVEKMKPLEERAQEITDREKSKNLLPNTHIQNELKVKLKN